MCLLAILYRVVDDAPLVIAANREEDYARGGTAPDLRSGPLPFIAGLDPVAGGTWLGINAARVVVAVTNRRKTKLPDRPRSRGLLTKDLLRFRTALEAKEAGLRELSTNNYAGCNLVCADADSIWVIHASDWLRCRSLAPGIHLMTNGDVNDETDERIRAAVELLRASPISSADDALDVLQVVARQATRRGPSHGTVSSTLLSVPDRLRRGKLLHADGAPDSTSYAVRTGLLWELDGLALEKRV
jgi:uncharacterized protein with NRDE domain